MRIVFTGRDGVVRNAEPLNHGHTAPHPITDEPMLCVVVTNGPDVGATYWVLKSLCDDILGAIAKL